ncbi:MAG: NB-ARC domain-containing protein [Cyanobacteria bacterium P01_A01_bin.45]
MPYKTLIIKRMRARDNSQKIEEEFIEAKRNWELEKLYVDLGSAKGKALTPVEKKFLRGLLCGFSPAEIAKTVYNSSSSSTVRVYLSNGLYKYLEEMLSNQAGENVKVKSWSRVTHLLEKSGYKKSWSSIQDVNSVKDNIQNNHTVVDSNQTESWGKAIDINNFYGRIQQLDKIESWVDAQSSRLILLLGMGGSGKTALTAKLVQQFHSKFSCIIWRNLRRKPCELSLSESSYNVSLPLEVTLNQILQTLSPGFQTVTAENLDDGISELINCLRSTRCLLIFDAWDAILCTKDEYSGMNIHDSYHDSSRICYQRGHEMYGELLRRLGESPHQSCVILNSREKPQEIAMLEGEALPVKSLFLDGLEYQDCNHILKAKGLISFKSSLSKKLVDIYAGNPLFIKLIATVIQELFAGSISNFLKQGTLIFGDIRMVLDQQFNRLSDLEQQIVYFLALNKELTSLNALQEAIVPKVSQRVILEAIESLQRRSLIAKNGSHISQTQVLTEYIVEKLIEEQFNLMQQGKYSFSNYSVFESHFKKYIREVGLNSDK